MCEKRREAAGSDLPSAMCSLFSSYRIARVDRHRAHHSYPTERPDRWQEKPTRTQKESEGKKLPGGHRGDRRGDQSISTEKGPDTENEGQGRFIRTRTGGPSGQARQKNVIHGTIREFACQPARRGPENLEGRKKGWDLTLECYRILTGQARGEERRRGLGQKCASTNG